mgnify:CR=1 FL=1|tara:strand:- start:1101 stop:1295 length:195 start_codon:yes stop_codon:yes gene_type:complete
MNDRYFVSFEIELSNDDMVILEECPEDLGAYIHDNLIEILSDPTTQAPKYLCVGETMATLKPVK